MRRLFLLVLVLSSLAWAERGQVERADGTRIVFYFDAPSAERYPVAVILQGSECLRVSDKYTNLVSRLMGRGVAVLRVEKPGLSEQTPIGDCPEEYLRLNTPDRRVLDLLAVLGHLRRNDPHWNGDLGMCGGSEGALIASLSAPLASGTQAVLLFSGGGGWNFSQEVAGSIAAQMKASGASSQAIDAQMEKIRKQWEQIRSNPVPGKEWASDGKLGRNTYQWWNQALDQALYRPLLQLQVPIRAYQGSQDESIPAASSEELVARFEAARKTNFELRTYPGGHGPPEDVLLDGFDWLVQNLRR